MSSIRSTNPLMKMTNLAVNFGELISFLSIEQEYPRASWPIPSGKPKLGVPTLSPDFGEEWDAFPRISMRLPHPCRVLCDRVGQALVCPWTLSS